MPGQVGLASKRGALMWRHVDRRTERLHDPAPKFCSHCLMLSVSPSRPGNELRPKRTSAWSMGYACGRVGARPIHGKPRSEGGRIVDVDYRCASGLAIKKKPPEVAPPLVCILCSRKERPDQKKSRKRSRQGLLLAIWMLVADRTAETWRGRVLLHQSCPKSPQKTHPLAPPPSANRKRLWCSRSCDESKSV